MKNEARVLLISAGHYSDIPKNIQGARETSFWAGQDSNLGRHKASAFTARPRWPLGYLPETLHFEFLEPRPRIELGSAHYHCAALPLSYLGLTTPSSAGEIL